MLVSIPIFEDFSPTEVIKSGFWGCFVEKIVEKF